MLCGIGATALELDTPRNSIIVEPNVPVIRGKFDAVFSKKGADGQPLRICNYLTGDIDTTVFAH